MDVRYRRGGGTAGRRPAGHGTDGRGPVRRGADRRGPEGRDAAGHAPRGRGTARRDRPAGHGADGRGPARRSPAGRGPVWRTPAAGAAAQVLLLVLLGASVGLGPAGWLTGGVLAVAVPALLAGALRRSGASAPGPADRVTLARTVLGGGVAALVADGTGHGAVLTGLAAAALALDAVDGRVARRTGTASPLGARFDMEADAFLILVLSVRAAASCGAWVLAAGAMRYAFVAAARVAPWLRAALPPSLARKAVAAQQGVTLAVVCAGVLPPAASAAVAAAALAALVWSFGRDTVWLWRARPRGAVAAASGLTDAAARAGLPPAPAAPAGPARAGGAEVLPVAAGLPGLPGLAVAAAVAGPARPQDGPGRDRGARVAAGPVRLRQAGFPAEGQSSRCGR